MSLDSERYQGLAGIRLALRRFLAASEQISKAAGVTQQQYQALLAIKTWPSPTMTMGDLAEQLLLTHHAAVQLVDRMARAGIAARAPSSTDRRSVHLRLTPEGEALVEQLAEQHLDEILRQEPQLTRSLRRLRRISAEGDGEKA
ncbi:MAG TPA: MarR family transcriptional regulator [Caulobacteraceae bacterium]|nr:MarR family transcriptional regulator [Caulobacteraceae bacterium]